MSHHLHEALQRRRWELVEAIAVRQHEPADPRRVGVEQVLADRAAGVVADEGDVGEVEVLEEGDHLAGHAAWRLIGGGGDRVRVRAERKVGSVRTDACGGEAGGNPLHNWLSTRIPWTNTTGGEGGSSGPASR